MIHANPTHTHASELPPGPWYVPHRPSLERVPPAQQSLVTRLMLGVVRRAAATSEDLEVFVVLSRLGPLFPRYLLFLSHLLRRGAIPRADKERIILRVAWRLGCIYEWGHHATMARDLGVSADEIRSIAEETSDRWTPRLRTLLAATDEILERRRFGDDTWASLREELREDQLVELCFVVGHYVMVAGTINGMSVRLEPGYLRGIGGPTTSARSTTAGRLGRCTLQLIAAVESRLSAAH